MKSENNDWNNILDKVSRPNIAIEAIIIQHAEEAAFLWLLRNAAVHFPHYTLRNLTDLDDRVEAHLDGLHIAADVGWTICKVALCLGGPGEIFAASVLAFESGEKDRVQSVLNIGGTTAELSQGVISALGWLSYRHAQGPIRNLLTSASATLRRIGIAASAAHRQDPGQPLFEALSDEDPLLRARALKAVGEFGRLDLLPALRGQFNVAEDNCRFAAVWSAALLGNSDALPILHAIASAGAPQAENCVKVALRCLDLSAAQQWQRELAHSSQSRHLAIIGAGVIGDPTQIPWLIDCMSVPELARVAGEAFTTITGIDLAYEDLEGERPEGFEAGPMEDPADENVAMDPDENLPWPNPELVQRWWAQYRRQFQTGTRYLLGQPISLEWLQQVLRIGCQRQRAAAALELAIRQRGQPLFEVRAPGFRQQQILRSPG